MLERIAIADVIKEKSLNQRKHWRKSRELKFVLSYAVRQAQVNKKFDHTFC